MKNYINNHYVRTGNCTTHHVLGIIRPSNINALIELELLEKHALKSEMRPDELSSKIGEIFYENLR